jgi:hypothetical protein
MVTAKEEFCSLTVTWYLTKTINKDVTISHPYFLLFS